MRMVPLLRTISRCLLRRLSRTNDSVALRGVHHRNVGLRPLSASARSTGARVKDEEELSRRLERELRSLLPLVEFSTNPYELERHGRGESYHPVRRPDVVAMPRNTSDVRAIVRYCVRNTIPVVPFGAGTSLEGHVCALHGGVSLDTTLMNSMDLPDMTGAMTTEGDQTQQLPDPIAVVGAGVTRKQLNDALRQTGLQFVVDPGADATLGGMVATGASGTTTVRYGSMRDNILELECVLPDEDGTVVRAGTKALKNSAGYDLVSLFCGSEGTLGVITEITVRLHPVPDHVLAAVCAFGSVSECCRAVTAIRFTGLPVTRCELLNSTCMRAFNAYNNKMSKSSPRSMAEKPTLFLEFQGSSEASLQELVAMTEDICVREHGGSSFDYATSEEERRGLWSARHKMHYANIALRPGATSAIATDTSVPLSQFADVVDATAADIEQRHGMEAFILAHAADGNFHCTFPIKPEDPDEYLREIHGINERLVRRALAAGGTCTGEHGIGYGKMPYLERQYGPGAIRAMQSIKGALDPYNIMNPGKVVVAP